MALLPDPSACVYFDAKRRWFWGNIGRQSGARSRDLALFACGQLGGPPFPSPIYAPNHHPDDTFFAQSPGCNQTIEDFGSMPPQPNVTLQEVGAIVVYIPRRQADAASRRIPRLTLAGRGLRTSHT